MRTMLFLYVLVLLTSCSRKKVEENETNINLKEVQLTSAQMDNAEIVTGKLEQMVISSILRASGKIDVPPRNTVSVSVPMGGYLKSTGLMPGMHVNKGQVIARIEGQQYIQLQQDYLTAKARIGYLESEYKRQKELNRDKAVSDKIFQQAETEYRSQLVLITALKEKIKLAGINPGSISEYNIQGQVNIHSPISGYVSKVNVNIGTHVSPSDVLFELINPDDIHLALKVFEKDLGKLYIGQKVTAFTNSQPEKKYSCEIILISKDISEDRSAEVHCHFDIPNRALMPGSYMNAEIRVKNIQAYALPSEAIVHFEGKDYIFRGTGKNLFEMTEVTTGENESGHTEIILGSNRDLLASAIVIKGAYSLLMMLKNKQE